MSGIYNLKLPAVAAASKAILTMAEFVPFLMCCFPLSLVARCCAHENGGLLPPSGMSIYSKSSSSQLTFLHTHIYFFPQYKQVAAVWCQTRIHPVGLWRDRHQFSLCGSGDLTRHPQLLEWQWSASESSLDHLFVAKSSCGSNCISSCRCYACGSNSLIKTLETRFVERCLFIMTALVINPIGMPRSVLLALPYLHKNALLSVDFLTVFAKPANFMLLFV